MRCFLRYIIPFLVLPCLAGNLAGCRQEKAGAIRYEALDPSATGIHFANNLKVDSSLNMFRYMYFYNGAGAGAGDFNQDGLTDVFLASNQGANTLYLNKGQFRFEDVTQAAGLVPDGGWSTGVSVVDINRDGLLDIYVCRVSRFGQLKAGNQLWVCREIKNGIPLYEEKAEEYGLSFFGFSSQAAFLDYDMDGDLDMFLMNHSLHNNGTFAERKTFDGTYHEFSGDRFFRNDQDHFTDVTRQVGIKSSAIGYGLGISVADINLDGYPDIYIGNDFHENDYLYINRRDGSFEESATQALMHSSQFSMGVDLADINNDAFPEIISVDMLPDDYEILKRSLGEDEYNIARMKIRYGYQHQYTRNNLQLNRRNGMFSEIGLYSGIYATDWSWAPLWLDMDNDGLKDLFISNGIPKRLNDIDYVNYVSNDEIQKKIGEGSMNEKDMAVIDKFPQIRLPNKFFRNAGELRFSDETGSVRKNEPGFSNGAVYADFDNDGLLDILVNNIDAPAMLYRNRTDAGLNRQLAVTFKGSPSNPRAVGAKVILYSGSQVFSFEKTAAHGFLSSMEIPLHVAVGQWPVDSAFIIWPDRSFQPFRYSPGIKDTTITWKPGQPIFNFERFQQLVQYESAPLADITSAAGLSFRHDENEFIEFNREPLMPNMLSTEGPALAAGDLNGDGLEDFFVGASRNKKPALFVQEAGGRFSRVALPALETDSAYEDTGACWADLNGDGHQDLAVASGGNEFYGKDKMLLPRVYLNNGQGQLEKLPDAFGEVFLTASVIRAADFNRDGAPDLFIGARAVPFAYGAMPRSYLLLNDGRGRFRDMTRQLAPGLLTAGFITDASLADMDGDGDDDILLSREWGTICFMENQQGSFSLKEIGRESGWWNTALAFDADGDGDLDVLAGNLGLNSRLKAAPGEPVKLYYSDFDGNGRSETILTYYHSGRERPFANKFELEKQLPYIKKNFLYAGDFAKASLGELIGEEKLKKASQLYADHFATTLYRNKGNGKFDTEPLPWQSQLSPVRTAAVADLNQDGLPDLLLGGNFYGSNIEMGRYDADFGTALLNSASGQFRAEPFHPVLLKNELRHLLAIRAGGKQVFIAAMNNDSLRLLTLMPKNQ